MSNTHVRIAFRPILAPLLLRGRRNPVLSRVDQALRLLNPAALHDPLADRTLVSARGVVGPRRDRP